MTWVLRARQQQYNGPTRPSYREQAERRAKTEHLGRKRSDTGGGGGLDAWSAIVGVLVYAALVWLILHKVV